MSDQSGGPKGPTGPVWPPTGPVDSSGAMGATGPTGGPMYYGGSTSNAFAITTFDSAFAVTTPTGAGAPGVTGRLRVSVRIDGSAIICPHCGGPLVTDLTGHFTRPGTVKVDGIGACPDPTCAGKRAPGEARLIVRGEENDEEIIESGVFGIVRDDSDEPDDPALTDPDLWR